MRARSGSALPGSSGLRMAVTRDPGGTRAACEGANSRLAGAGRQPGRNVPRRDEPRRIAPEVAPQQIRVARGPAADVKSRGFPASQRGVAVIESGPSPVAGPGAQQLLLRPRRALTPAQFAALFAVLGGAIAVVAAVNFRLGNVLAPWFALADTVFVAAVLRQVWRRGERTERIVVGDCSLEVHRAADAAPVFQAHPLWVRLVRERQRGEARVWLRSMGREVEVGAFLAEGERLEMALRLEDLLARSGW